MSRNQTVNYRFLLPQVKKEPVGNQGEVAQIIPYRLEEGVTEESIRQELEAQPHMEPLLRSLDPGRKIYLLESASMEVLELAAEYIGTYHRLANNDADCFPGCRWFRAVRNFLVCLSVIKGYTCTRSEKMRHSPSVSALAR